MSNYTSHLAGTFCWIELCSRDWAKDKTFFCTLFDWRAEDQPMGLDQYYTMAQIKHHDVAAMYQMEAQRLAANVPSHWLNYIAVDNLDDMLDKAEALDAELIYGPVTVGESGRTAMLQDPQGAYFALWQAEQHIGSKKMREHGALCWVELASKDAKQSVDFYKALLGWRNSKVDKKGVNYNVFRLDGNVAGMLELKPEWGVHTPHWMTYFQVDDIQLALSNVRRLGGEICVPAIDIEGKGRFAVLNSPSGAVFALWQYN